MRMSSASFGEEGSFSFKTSYVEKSPELTIPDPDFQFDSVQSDLAISPKLICPNSSPPKSRTPGEISLPQQVNPPSQPAISPLQPVTNPNGPSVRQLMASDKYTESMDIYTAPSTPRTPRSPMAMTDYMRDENYHSFEESPRPKRSQSSGKSSKRPWAFKDLLRRNRTVPSYKLDNPAAGVKPSKWSLHL